MRTKVPAKKKKSTSGGGHRLMVTLCRKHDSTDIMRNRGAHSDSSVDIIVNRRMIETWYVYKALSKFVDGVIEVYEVAGENVRLINRDEFIHTKGDSYELTTITIHPDSPEDAFVETSPHLVTGFF